MFVSRVVMQFLIVPSVFAISACAAFSPTDLVNPKSVTVEQALSDVGAGFASMKQELNKKGPTKLGLYPCKVSLELAVKSSADQNGKLVLDNKQSQSTSSGVGFNFDAEQENKSSASRGNTIKVEMYSIPCIPKETLAFEKPDKVKIVAKAAEEAVIFSPQLMRPNSPFID